MKISIVTPIYNEEENIEVFYERIQDVFKHLQKETNREFTKEIVFIDDGSTDSSFNKIKKLSQENSDIRGISLSRNYGSHTAICAGLLKATGDAAVIIACDLQDPPELIIDFVKKWLKGSQIVWGKRIKYETGFLRSCINKVFYTLVKKYAIKTYPAMGTGSFCLIDRKIIDNLNKHPEHNRITFGLIAYQGFKQEYIEYERLKRQRGNSGWTTSKLLKAGLDTFLSFSYFPVRFMSLVGIITFALSILGALYTLWCWLAIGIKVPGWTTIIILLFIFHGIQFLMLGILGEYIWRVSDEVKNRPLFFIQEETTNISHYVRDKVQTF